MVLIHEKVDENLEQVLVCANILIVSQEYLLVYFLQLRASSDALLQQNTAEHRKTKIEQN